LRVDRLSATRAAFPPRLTVFWDESNVIKKDHHFDEALAPHYFVFGVHIALSVRQFELLTP
jgi:hypothetical protein